VTHDTRWDARIARARALASRHPAASEILTFYAELAGFQKAMPGPAAFANRPRAAVSVSCFDAVVATIPAFLDFLSRTAPPQLAAASSAMRGMDDGEWRASLDRYFLADGDDGADADPAVAFVVEVLMQPFMEAFACATEAPGRWATAGDVLPGQDARMPGPVRRARCPCCSGEPVVGVLREEGQSARRSLVCGSCLHEWSWPRIVCPACGEDQFESLPVYQSETLPAARVDACDTCKTYLKTIDLSKDGLAIPVVDDLASIALDLWAREQGYTKLRANLLRM
jgi:FdhE protein